MGEENKVKEEKFIDKAPFWVKILLATLIFGVCIWLLPFLWATLIIIAVIAAPVVYMVKNPDDLEGKAKIFALLILIVFAAGLIYLYIHFQILYMFGFIRFDLIRDILILVMIFGFCFVFFSIVGQLVSRKNKYLQQDISS
jgi:hypothetical protein